MKKLVVYFSATGHTADVAERLAETLGADTAAIVPAVPYTPHDLDWNDKNSRSTVEMDDPTCRPAMKGKPDISGYDVIYLGFPVWWYREPSIVDTFLEGTDFSGKALIPFVTSSASGMGSIMDNIRRLAPGAKVCDGRRFDIQVSGDTLRKWAEELGI